MNKGVMPHFSRVMFSMSYLWVTVIILGRQPVVKHHYGKERGEAWGTPSEFLLDHVVGRARLSAVPRPPLTVRQVGALSNLDNVSVRIADVAAYLAVLGDRLREELRSSAFPQFVARLNIRNAEIQKAVDVIRVGDAERYRRLIRSGPAAHVQNHPEIRQLKVRRRVAVTQVQNASVEDLLVVASRSLDVGDGEKMRNADPLPRGHLIAFLFDLYGVHGRLQFRYSIREMLDAVMADFLRSINTMGAPFLAFVARSGPQCRPHRSVLTLPVFGDSF